MVKDYVVVGIGVGFVNELVFIIDIFCCNQGLFGIQFVEDVVEFVFFGIDQVFCWNFQIVKEQFVGFVFGYIGDGVNFYVVVDGFFQIDYED